ncbi:MAG: outer membrane beta-barrel protein [Pseudomonadota bacterium]
MSSWDLPRCLMTAALIATATPAIAQQSPTVLNRAPNADTSSNTSATAPGASNDPRAPSSLQAPATLRQPSAQLRRPLRPSPVLRDGDFPIPQEPETPRDGFVTLEPEPRLRDGTSPDIVDQRTEDEIAVFNNPPAGFDPQLFQIDDLSTASDRRIRRLFTQQPEPFDPVGMRIGSFILFPEIEIVSNFASNVLSSPDDSPDRSFEVTPSARLVSNWANHAVELRGSVNASSFNEFKTEDERGFQLEARGRLDVRRSTNIQGLISRQRAQESRSAIDAATAGPRTTVVSDRGEGALNHRFNRLSLQLRGGITSSSFSDDVDSAGAPIPNDRDFEERDIALRTSWEFKPTLSVFGEVVGNHRDFSQNALSDGLSRNSTGIQYRLGVSFGQTGAYLRGEFALGYGRQNLDEDSLRDSDGLIFDANLAWQATGLTTILFNATTGFENSNTAGTGGVFERRFDLDVRHALRPYLIAEAGVGFANRGFAGIGLDEREVAWNLGLEYTLRREAVVFGTYERTVFRSDFADSDFENNELRIGMRLRR